MISYTIIKYYIYIYIDARMIKKIVVIEFHGNKNAGRSKKEFFFLNWE